MEETTLTCSSQNPDSTYHTESPTTFEIIHSPNHAVILGLPWLRLHQPRIDWSIPALHLNSEFSRLIVQLPTNSPNISNLPWLAIPPLLLAPSQPWSKDRLSNLPWLAIPPLLLAPSQPWSKDRLSNLPWLAIPPLLLAFSQPWFKDRLSNLPWLAIPLLFAPGIQPAVAQNSTHALTPPPIPASTPPSSHTTTLPPQYAEFSDVFQKSNADKLPPHRPYDCAIDLLPGKQPPWGQIYSLSPDEQVLVQEYLEENLKKGFIQKSTSSAGAPIFFVDKEKDPKAVGKAPAKRLVVNYQGLDKVTEKFRYPLPLIKDLLDHLLGAKIFTKIDLRSAYNLLRIREGDEWKTAFRTKFGLYEYLVMPFGLANAPAYFQHFVNDIFTDVMGKFVVIYLDDFLIYSKDETSHQAHVREVLKRLRQHQLFAKLEKCQFGAPSIKFLGAQVSSYGVEPDVDKVRSIQEWPRPCTKKEVLSFLGVANYLRKFVDNYSKMAAPLHRLSHKDVPFLWTEECKAAFESIKSAITSAPVLAHADPSQPFWVETDASDFAVGGVLAQKDTNGDLHPCAFYSRSLNPAERNYCIYEKEL